MKNKTIVMEKKSGEFRPAPQFRSLYYIFYIIFLVLAVLLLSPFMLFLPLWIFLIITSPFILIFLFVLIWIPMYWRTIIYRLTGDDMTWRRGVWFRKTGIVPYNRITNVDIEQGPISRALGIASLKIQTAGYSAPSGRASEIKIEGVRDSEELRERIMGFVKGRRPVAVETYDEDTGGSRVLGELVKIRKLLEKKGK
jgi:membrane protein YdbS with pleckstrin-like domain